MTSRLTKVLGGIALGAVALSICGFFYRKTQAVDMDAHLAFTDELGAVERLSTVLKQQTLASRFGLLNQYDALTATETSLSAAVAQLRPELSALPHARRETLARLSELENATAELRGDVERFKTANSVLKNSLYYLPTAGDRLAGSLTASGAGGSQLAGDVTRLVQTTLVYNLIRGQGIEELLRQEADLSARATSVPEPLQLEFELFLQHADRALRQHEVVDPLIERLSSSKADKALSALDAAYSRDFEHEAMIVNRFRVALYGWSLLLLGVCIWGGLKLRRLYAELEDRVKDRTMRLNAALEELCGEMELARKIQRALVPAAPQLDNCDVAAVMRPAERVGGDYYDIFREGGQEWILIGDVSGHGVPAGLIMMMCQTAVRTALASNPELQPNQLLVIVNRTLTDNIRRLGEDKYMTISALCRDAKGCFHHAGLHQDLLIYRAESKRVDVIRSEGAWLGIVDDIDRLLQVRSFELAAGDVLFLYTDGITEAVSIGDGTMLDNVGLASLLEEVGGQQAQEIVSSVVLKLDAYAVSDDVAAVAVKQC